MLKTFAEIYKAVEKLPKKIISVASAEDLNVLGALKSIEEKQIADAILVGNPDKIEEFSNKLGYVYNEDKIFSAKTPEEAALISIELIRSGKADILMKGHLSTSTLMKAVLDREKGLRTGNILSHIAVVEVKSYSRLMFVTDGGINVELPIDVKKSILRNAVDLTMKLGIEVPSIAVLCPTEEVNPKIPETVDAAKLSEMAARGDFGNVILEGPVAMDVALSPKASFCKGIKSKITGKTDIFLVPNITTGNSLVKALMVLANAKVGGLVVGAKVPIILLSRSDSPKEKLNSIALSILACN